MLITQLVCEGCRRILSYPFGAISCRCRNCDTVNAAQNLRIDCPFCAQQLLVPINTLRLLCPCCGTVTDIPESFLPLVEDPIDLGGLEQDSEAKTIYVSYPAMKKADSKEGLERQQSSRSSNTGGGSGDEGVKQSVPMAREELEGRSGSSGETGDAAAQSQAGGANTVVIATRIL